MTNEHSTDDLLRNYLQDRDVDCPVCRYNLRGCSGSSCPECGARIDLRVGSIDLKLGPWLLCMFAIAIPMGFMGIMAAVGTVYALRTPTWGNRDWLIMGAYWALTALNGVGLWLLSRKRGWLLRRPADSQWRWAGLLAGVITVVQVLIIWFLIGIL